MATQTTVNVNVKVDDKQVNSAVKSTENLRKEIKRLEVELTKVEIGSKEFENLSEQLKDNRDKLDLVRAKSKDLLDSFSMLPGPIGQIGSSITSTSDKLKIFSSFNLKDVKGQFKAVGDDIKLVASNIGKATGITKLYETTVGGLTKVFSKLPIGLKAASTAASGFGKALIATGIGAIVIAVGALIANFDSLKSALMNLIPGLGKVADFVGGLINKFTDFVGITSEAEREQKKFIEGLESGLKKEKENWEANADLYDEFTQRKVNANQKFKEKQIEILKDETKSEAEKNKLISAYRAQANREIEKADKDRAKKNDEAAKAELDKNKQKNDKIIADNKAAADKDKQRRQEEQDAIVQNLKNNADTDEKVLRAALEKQFAIRNEGKEITIEQAKLQANEINKIVEDELNKDKEARQKAFDEKLKIAQEFGKLELDTLNIDIETKKIKYGEDSQEYRNAIQAKFDKQFELLNAEETALKEKEQTKDGLTQDELNRLAAIKNERNALTNEVEKTNNEQIASDIEKALKTAETDKMAADQKYADKMKAAENDFALQQKILDDKIAQDEAFYTKLLSNEELTAEQRKKIEEEYTKTKQANADAQAAIDQKKFDNQQKLLQATSQILKFAAQELGEQTFAGKALAAAASLIDTYGAITAVLKNAGKGPQGGIPGFAIAQAVATGLVGFKAVSNILKTPVPSPGGGGGASERPRGLALGGIVSGPGSGRSDLVPAMLSNGESVINAQSTAMFKPLLSSINAIGGGRRFADGGLAIGSFSTDQAFSQLQTTLATQQAPIKTYVVSSDMTNQQMLDRNIKDRSTL
jgi:hypothetical protein